MARLLASQATTNVHQDGYHFYYCPDLHGSEMMISATSRNHGLPASTANKYVKCVRNFALSSGVTLLM